MLGVLLGQIAFVRTHIDVLSVMIVVVSVLPIVITGLVRLRSARRVVDAASR